jgi:hypothetical protein
MSFDAVPLFAAMVSTAQRLNIFETVIPHEPKSAPVNQPATLALWLGPVTPLGLASGLGVTSGRVTIRGRIYLNWLSKPESAIDPKLLNLTCTLMGAYSGGFTLGGKVREIDLLGMYGEPMAAQPGYIEHDGKHFRAMEITFGLIVNDLWEQVP